MRFSAAALLVALLLGAASGHAPPLWVGIEPGPQRVGIDRLSRDGLDVTYWYPARPGGRAMQLRNLAVDPAAFVAGVTQAGLPEPAAEAYLDSPLYARLGAPRVSGKRPLLLIAQGNGQGPLDQAVLAEILASRGYVVATTPSPMLRSPMRSAAEVGRFAQQQAEELHRAVDLLGGLGVADVSRIAVVGHSFGARAALLLAMQDRRIKALASLDGGIGTAQALDSFKEAAWFDAARATVPILHFYETADAFMAPDFTLLRSLPSAALTLREVEGLHHAHFTTLGFGAALDRRVGTVTRMGPQAGESLRAVVAELLAFLERYR